MLTKRLITALWLLLATATLLSAQKDVTRDFQTFGNRMRDALQDRTSVQSALGVKKVTKTSDNLLQFVFTDNLSDFPWTPENTAWFLSLMKQNLPAAYSSCDIADVLADDVPLTDLTIAAAGNSGAPAASRYRVADPRDSRAALVSGIGAIPFEKGLSGRHIALWHSHGKYFEAKEDRWEWQRAPTMQTVEDLYTQSYVLPFLIPMLENAGACVMTPRERDVQIREVICDNDPCYAGRRGPLERLSGKYTESGSWQDAGEGFADSKQVYKGYDNPFKMGSARMTYQEEDSDAQAVWTPDIPERGFYAVYISYRTLPESTDAALYRVYHMGGVSAFRVNQQYAGGTWVCLGTFEFDKGEQGRVVLSGRIPEGITPRGDVVTADAVRFGGGVGKIARGLPGGDFTTSSLPCYTEGAIYNMQFSGIDMHLMDSWETDYVKDYASRGAWVKQVNVPFDLALAFHSDAGTTKDDSTIGTLAIYTYRNKKDNNDKGKTTYDNGEDRMNGRVMAGMVQDEIVSAVRRDFDSRWSRRQLWNRNYSESRTPPVPSMILEILSHQNFADMKYGLDPRFRFTVSRAVYKGILKYLSSRYGCPYSVQPLPVRAFSAMLDSTGRAVLSWAATDDPLEPTAKPRGFLVQTRVDDGAFDTGEVVEAAFSDGRYSVTVDIDSGHIYSWRVTAWNDGGKSFPSETLSIGLCDGEDIKKVLIVNNFTRIAPPTWFDSGTYAGFRNDWDSGVPYMQDITFIGPQYEYRRALPWVDDDNPGFGASYISEGGNLVAGNTFDYPYIHGKSILKAGYSFISCSEEAFENASVGDDCFAIDLICGKQVTTRVGRGEKAPCFTVFPEPLRKRLSFFTSEGGHLLVSGARIGTDAWDALYELRPNAGEQSKTQTFIQKVLGWKWMSGFATCTGKATPLRNNTLSVSVSPSWRTDPNPDMYSVDNADGIVPASSSAGMFLRYEDTCIGAGIYFQGRSWKSVSLGFPIETIEKSSDRDALFRAVLDWFDQ